MPSLVSQATLDSYIKSSIYTKHISILSHNLKSLLSLLRKLTSNWDKNLVEIIGGYSGYYLTLKLNPDINCNILLNNLHKRNVLVTSNIVSYYHAENFDNSLRISLARMNPSNLKISLNIIYEEILKLY